MSRIEDHKSALLELMAAVRDANKRLLSERERLATDAAQIELLRCFEEYWFRRYEREPSSELRFRAELAHGKLVAALTLFGQNFALYGAAAGLVALNYLSKTFTIRANGRPDPDIEAAFKVAVRALQATDSGAPSLPLSLPWSGRLLTSF